MIAVSDWYAALGEYSFPTVFVNLGEEDVRILLAGDPQAAGAKPLLDRLQGAMDSFHGNTFVATDVCAPTDSPGFAADHAAFYARSAWALLAGSGKVQAALREGATRRLIVRPYRRMDRIREFRMFFHGRRLAAMSQYCLERHFGRLAKREAELWTLGCAFAEILAPGLPTADVTADVYLTSKDQFLLVDLNSWGAPTEPLLLRSWDRDWEAQAGLKLIPKPVRMDGDISISF